MVTSPRSRGRSGYGSKASIQGGLVDETTLQCDFRQLQAAMEDERFRLFYTALQKIPMSWHSKGLLERSCEVARGEAASGS